MTVDDGVSDPSILFLGAFLADHAEIVDDAFNITNAAYAWLPVQELGQDTQVRVVAVFAGEQDGPEAIAFEAWVAGPGREPLERSCVLVVADSPVPFVPRVGQPVMWQLFFEVPFRPLVVGRHTVVITFEGKDAPIVTVPFAVTVA